LTLDKRGHRRARTLDNRLLSPKMPVLLKDPSNGERRKRLYLLHSPSFPGSRLEANSTQFTLGAIYPRVNSCPHDFYTKSTEVCRNVRTCPAAQGTRHNPETVRSKNGHKRKGYQPHKKPENHPPNRLRGRGEDVHSALHLATEVGPQETNDTHGHALSDDSCLACKSALSPPAGISRCMGIAVSFSHSKDIPPLSALFALP